MSNKTVEVKRKIISLLRNRESKEALKLFHKNFSDEKPVELEFVKNLYVELNRLDLNKEAFELLATIGVWYPDNEEFQEIFENATQTYVSKLILQANNIKFERLEKEKSLEDSLKRADSLTREKMQVENSKQLQVLNEKSKDLFKLAVSLSPKNLTAYRGWLECCEIDNDEDEANEIRAKIESLTATKKVVQQNVANEETIVKKEEPKVDEFAECEKLFKEKKYQELIDKVTKLEEKDFFPTDCLLLKAKALVELKSFKEADKAMFEAERTSANYYLVKQTKDEINAIKLNLYIKAGSSYLQKGIKLGLPLGNENFHKAKFCIFKALEINPDDLDVLDMAYSALKYLGDDKEAFRVKATIYSIQANYKITYDSKYNQTLCFIATYAFNDKPSIINEFRWFRREYLLNNRFGKRINSLYVCLSPRITKSLQDENFFRYVFRFILYFPLMIIRLLKYAFDRNR